MAIAIQQVGPEWLSEYARIPIAFEVRTVFEIELVQGGLGGIALHEVEVTEPYIKDYDAHPDGGPEAWPERFDASGFTFFIASQAKVGRGAAAVVYDTPGIHMLGGRKDLSVLWDIRVHPRARRSGIGTELFGHVVRWSREHDLKQLKIETQNINVPACRFYARQGCRLGEIDRYAYAHDPRVAHEVMLIWYLDL
jgi:GNAT superfamily N-acetyltransferase